MEDNDITEFVIYVVFLVIILKIISLASRRKIDEIISIGLKKAIRFTKKHIFFWEVEIIKSENGNNIKYKIKPRVLKFWNEFNLMNYTWWILLFPLVAFVNCLYYRKEIGVSLGVLVFFLVPCVVLLFVLRKNK